jgi:hypothetical protein
MATHLHQMGKLEGLVGLLRPEGLLEKYKKLQEQANACDEMLKEPQPVTEGLSPIRVRVAEFLGTLSERGKEILLALEAVTLFHQR